MADSTGTFPKLKLVEGRGFDHEIVQADSIIQPRLAQVHGDDEGLRLARLFTAAPELLEALQTCLDALKAALPHLRYTDMFAVGARNDVDDAIEVAHDALEKATGSPRCVASRARIPDGGD